MSGAFYGSLAASASVFVAILTALLVNKYVQIKSDRRQVTNELNNIEEELKGLKKQRDTYSDTVEELEDKRENQFKEIAEERVDEFIEEEIPGDIHTPIEHLEVSDLYQELIRFHDCESSEDLEESTEKLHHREILENRMNEIEDKILYNIVHSFAKERQGDGWDSQDSDLAEAFEEPEQEDEEEDETASEDEETVEIDVKAEDLRTEPLTLDDFIKEYKEEYSLDDLDQKTRDLLEIEYDEVVDQNPVESLNSTMDSVMGSLGGAAYTASQARQFDRGVPDFSINQGESTIGLTPKEERELDEAEKNLRDIENQIDTLERTKDRLEIQKEGLNPEDLKPVLYVNAATISLSVVIPIAAYFDTLTDFTVTQLHFLNIWWITGSWLLGLIFVFVAIYLRITERKLRNLLPQRFQ